MCEIYHTYLLKFGWLYVVGSTYNELAVIMLKIGI